MINVDILVLSDDVIVDAETKRQSVISMFDRIQTEKVPVLIPRMCIFARLKGTAGHHTAYVEFLSPPEAGVPSQEVTCPFDLKSDGDMHNIKVAIMPVPLPVYGRYTVRALDEKRSQLAETFLDVVPKG